MHDLRRQALESGKTVSRKARSRQASAPSSRANSRPNSKPSSRCASRQNSDDEEENLSDGTTWSFNSIDDVLSSEDAEIPIQTWTAELADRIEQILERKRSSASGREESLNAYTQLLSRHFAQEEIQGRIRAIIPALLKSIKTDTNEKEAVGALKALAVTVLTDPSDAFHDAFSQPLRRVMNDSESNPVKAAAIRALSTVTFYSEAASEELEELMEYLLEVIESDGNSIGAGDADEVVVAALEEWGFLATQMEDMEEQTETAMAAFIDQLDSSYPGVQIAAGENIALLYEKSYTPLEDDEDPPSDDDGSDTQDEASPDSVKMVRRYPAYRRDDQLKRTLNSLATVSSRGISKKDKKSLHANFSDILNSVENPTRGPRYQNAVSHETGKRYGSRMTVRIHRAGEMRIDQWWKLHRLKALRRILQGGFLTHYQKNSVVFESLPIIISR